MVPKRRHSKIRSRGYTQKTTHNIKKRRKFEIKNNLHVSDGLFVHYQESKTVRTASGTCHTGSEVKSLFVFCLFGSDKFDVCRTVLHGYVSGSECRAG
jgi:hypothetical protein